MFSNACWYDVRDMTPEREGSIENKRDQHCRGRWEESLCGTLIFVSCVIVCDDMFYGHIVCASNFRSFGYTCCDGWWYVRSAHMVGCEIWTVLSISVCGIAWLATCCTCSSRLRRVLICAIMRADSVCGYGQWALLVWMYGSIFVREYSCTPRKKFLNIFLYPRTRCTKIFFS